MTLPDVSPIVGERRLTQTSQAAISAQSRSSSTYASRTMPSPDRPSRCSRRSRSKPGETAPTSSSRASGRSRRSRAKASSSCGIRLLAFTFPNEPISGAPSSSAGETGACSHAGCGIRHTGPSYPAARARPST